MAGTKKSPSKVKTGGKVVAIIGLITTLSQYITPEMRDQATRWLHKQNFSKKFIDLVSAMHVSGGKDSLGMIGHQCDAVEELIATKASELGDDAPITQWREELDKLRRGVKLMSDSPTKDRKKMKALEGRAKRLFDSTFNAAVN